MKRKFLIIYSLLLSFFLISCAPVLHKELMETGIREISFSDIKQNPIRYQGKLFILGGIIVNTKLREDGTLIEALYVSVDSRGYLKGIGRSHERFLALFPRESGVLDPIIFRPGREVTIAAEFLRIQEGKIDDLDYVYPLFKIKELYLWEERKEYYLIPYYYEPYPFWWDYPYWWDRPYWRWRYRVPPPYWW